MLRGTGPRHRSASRAIRTYVAQFEELKAKAEQGDLTTPELILLQKLDLADLHDYDLMILDVMLPVKSGFEVCRELRTRGSAVPLTRKTATGAEGLHRVAR